MQHGRLLPVKPLASKTVSRSGGPNAGIGISAPWSLKEVSRDDDVIRPCMTRPEETPVAATIFGLSKSEGRLIADRLIRRTDNIIGTSDLTGVKLYLVAMPDVSNGRQIEAPEVTIPSNAPATNHAETGGEQWLRR